MSSPPRTDAGADATLSDRVADSRYAPPSTIGRYVLISQVGAGAMGVVFAAYDPELDRRVAVKVIHPSREASPATRDRQSREARALAKIAHPNVVAVYDVGTTNDKVFIAMELVEGQTLDAWLRQRERDWPETLGALIQAGEGLAAAHAQDVVHRDFKPANVIVGVDGRVRVMDFGIARAPRSTAPGFEPTDGVPSNERTYSDARIAFRPQGTPAYMAPEQHSVPGDARCDQFAFCVATWEALYGKRPFGGRAPGALLEAILNGEIREPPAGTRVPAQIGRTLRRGLAADPEDRFPSMVPLLQALGTARPRSRRWAWIGGGLIGLATLLGALSWARDAERMRACDQLAQAPARVWDNGA